MPYYQFFQATRNPLTQHVEKSVSNIHYLKDAIYFYLENKSDDPQHYFFLGVSKHDGLPLIISLKSKQAFDVKAVQATIHGVLDNIMVRSLYKPPFNPVNGFDSLVTHRGSLREIAANVLIEYIKDIVKRPKPIIPYITKPLPKRWEENLLKLAAESNPNWQVISDDCMIDCFHHDSNYHTGELNKRFTQQQIKIIEESLLIAYRECQQNLPSHIDFAICSMEFLPRYPSWWSFSQVLFYCSNRGFSVGIDTFLSNYSNVPESKCANSEIFAESVGKVLFENFETDNTLEILDSDRQTVYAKLRTRELHSVMHRYAEFKWLPVLELQNDIYMQCRTSEVSDWLYPILGFINEEINSLKAADPAVSDEIRQTCQQFLTVINNDLKEVPATRHEEDAKRFAEIALNKQHPLRMLAVYCQQALAQIELAHTCKALSDSELKTTAQALLTGLVEIYQPDDKAQSDAADQEAEISLKMPPGLMDAVPKLVQLTRETSRYLQSAASSSRQAYTEFLNTLESQAEENTSLLASIKQARDLALVNEISVLAKTVAGSKETELQAKGNGVVKRIEEARQGLGDNNSSDTARLLEVSQKTQSFVAAPNPAKQKDFQAYVKNLQREKSASPLWQKLIAALMCLAGVILIIGSGLVTAASQGVALPVTVPTTKLGYTLSAMGLGVLLAAGGGYLWDHSGWQKKDRTKKGPMTSSVDKAELPPSSVALKGI